MIKNFRHKGLKQLFETGSRKGLNAQLAKRLTLQLDALDAARDVRDMDLPGFDLHELKGKRKGTWAVTVRANWRLTFKFQSSDALDVDLEDYH
jgi:proteic killer suppression protein